MGFSIRNPCLRRQAQSLPDGRQAQSEITEMIPYIVRRLLHMIPLIFGITLLSFIILHLAPGNYFTQMRMNPEISEETIRQMEAEFGLDQPMIVQYFRWMAEILQPVVDHVGPIPYVRPKLNFGYSFTYHVPIVGLIASRMLNTLILSVAAMVFSWLLAIPMGIYAALHPYSKMDKVMSFLAFYGMSVPSFFLAFLLLYLASATGWLPIGGMERVGYDALGFWGKLGDRLHHLIIPTLVLGTGGMAGLMRLMRGNMLDTLRENFVITARSKGLPERAVVYKHALRNAINPFITLFGYQLSGILSGAALTEIIVSWPGLGRLILDAVLSQDMFLVMGSILMGGVLLILGNLLADVLLAMSDPRVRVQ